MLVGALGLSQPAITRVNARPDVAGKTQAGWGGLVALDLFPSVQLESGLLWIPRRYEETQRITGLSFVTNYRYPFLGVPLLARFSPPGFEFFSLGAGGYFGWIPGKVTERTQAPGIDSMLTRDPSQSGLRKTDAGIALAVGTRWPVLPELRLVVDARYLHGLSNSATADATRIRTRDLQLLIGAGFSI